jgi:hypothetical protein
MAVMSMEPPAPVLCAVPLVPLLSLTELCFIMRTG